MNMYVCIYVIKVGAIFSTQAFHHNLVLSYFVIFRINKILPQY